MSAIGKTIHGEGRERILRAARSSFGEHGYNATTTKRIAARAAVSEPMIFRYFGSKERLFEQAVLAPFTDFASRRLADWESRGPGTLTPLEETGRIYEDLVDLFVAEQPVIVALLAVYHYDETTPNVTSNLDQVMRRIIALLESRASDQFAIRGNESVDVPAVVRLIVGMAFSVVALPSLFATGSISRRRLVAEMALMTVYGTRFRHLYTQEELIEGVGIGIARERVEQHLKPAINRPAAERRRSLVSDDTWRRVSSVLSTRPARLVRGRRRTSDRVVLEGILHVLIEQAPWTAVEVTEFGVSGVTCWRRLQDWQRSGLWPRISAELRAAGLRFAEPTALTVSP